MFSTARGQQKSKSRNTKTGTRPRGFDRYAAYRRTVQSADQEAVHLRNVYRELRGKEPLILREDFCGSFLLCCEWVKNNPACRAYGVDLDPEPIRYGRANYLPELKLSEAARVEILKDNVLASDLPKADLIAALNFSHYVLHDRRVMLEYFKKSRAALRKGGLFVLDSFGGRGYQRASEEVKKFDGLTYYWEQASFDPITNLTKFHIHFKPRGEQKIEEAFTYDWRMWGLWELRDILADAGFEKIHIYWEDAGDDGLGTGVYHRTEVGDDCETWVAYLVAER